MEEAMLSAIEQGRYNKWRHRKGLFVPEGTGAEFLGRISAGGTVVQPALLFRELGKKGFEFLAVSNVQLDSPAQLPDDIVLVPCFGPAAVAATDESGRQAVRIAERRMEAQGRFIYDGWMPVPDWSPEGLDARISRLDEVLAAFSLHSSCYFKWMYKYLQSSCGTNFAELSDSEVGQTSTVRMAADRIGGDPDRASVNRSLKWLAKAAAANQPEMRLLFAVLGLETLLKSKQQGNSQLLPKTANGASLADDGSLAEQLKSIVSDNADEPGDLVRRAREILPPDKMKWRVLSEIREVLPEQAWVADPRAGISRIYDIRNHLAHGSFDSGDLDLQTEVAKLAPKAMELLRMYLGVVLAETTGVPARWERRTMWQGLTMIAEDDGWVATGPTHMAVLFG